MNAYAEIKCSVGDKLIIGQFKLVKPIKVIDLSILSAIEEPCYSDATDFDELYGLFHFLKDFSNEVSKPVRESDSHLEYLPTQVLAEYFSHVQNIDAVIYPSSQTSEENNNIVILNYKDRNSDDDDNALLSFVLGSNQIHKITKVDYKTEIEYDEIEIPSPWIGREQ